MSDIFFENKCASTVYMKYGINSAILKTALARIINLLAYYELVYCKHVHDLMAIDLFLKKKVAFVLSAYIIWVQSVV